MTYWRAFFVTLLLSISPTQAAAQMVSGVVAVGERGCKKRDMVIISTILGYVVAEVYSGKIDKNDQVTGELNSYGFTDVLSNGMPTSLYINDFMLSRDKAFEKCFR